MDWGGTPFVNLAKNKNVEATVSDKGILLVDADIQDQHTPSIILRFSRSLGDITLDGEQTIDSYTLNVVAGHGASAGEGVNIKEYDETYKLERFFQAKITAAAATTLTLDRPLDFNFGAGTVLAAYRARVNMANEVGSVASPVVYDIGPLSGKWNITRIIVQVFTVGTMDDGKFGSIAKLTNGLTIRRKNGFVYNIANIKANGSWSAIGFDTRYLAKPPSGTGYGFSAMLTFAGQENLGVVQRLDSATNDRLEIWISDDLSAFDAADEYIIVAEGHVVGE